MTGTISNILSSKKFGFISSENGQEYFFHMSEAPDWDMLVIRFYENGAGKINVIFNPVKTPKGPRAVDVRIVEE